MQFSEKGLALGAGTVLAAANASRLAKTDPRLAFLVRVAHSRAPSASALAHLSKAVRRWSDGDESMARMHVVGRLQHPEADARRLFLAEALLDAGLAPDELLKAVATRPADADLAKYNADQPRVPAGNGRPSGRWTTSGATPGAPTATTARTRDGGRVPPRGSRASTQGRTAPNPTPLAPRNGPAPSNPKPPSATTVASVAGATAAGGSIGAGVDLGAMSGRALTALTTFVAGLAPAAALGVGLSLIPMDIPAGRWVSIAGPGDISIFQSPTVPGVSFRYTTADGVREDITVAPGPNGEFRDPKTGRVFARFVKTAGALKLLISTATLLQSKDPQLCINLKKESHGPLGRAYEDYVKAWFNPGNPTPSGFGNAFRKLRTDLPVVFDDCQKKTGILAEYKGPEYEQHLLKNDPPWWGMRSPDDYPGRRSGGSPQGFLGQPAHLLVLQQKRPLRTIWAGSSRSYIRKST